MNPLGDSSKFLVRYGAQLVTHTALLQGGQTITVFPTRAQKEHYRTQDTLFTIIEIPTTAEFVLQNDLSGILFMDDITNSYDAISGENGFLKRDAKESISWITDDMVASGRLYHLPQDSLICRYIKSIPHI